jgi:hypothetical protein
LIFNYLEKNRRVINIPLPSPFPASLSTALVTYVNFQPSAIRALILEAIKASLEAMF